MAGTRSDITADVNTAMQAREGTRFCHCVEMTFGQTIRARPGDATKPDTEVSWTGRGNLTTLRIYTSVDDGLTWQRVARSGDPIPNLGFNEADPPVYSAAHAATTNRQVQARIVFEGGGNAVVDSFTIRVTFEDASVIERIETGSALADGRLVNVRYDAGVGGLRAFPDVSLRLHGNRGAAHNPTVHGGDAAKTGMHLSHGNYQVTVQGSVIEWQVNEDARREYASMAFEGWFYPEKTEGFLCGWTTTPSSVNWGTTLQLIETSATGAKMRWRTREWEIRAPIQARRLWEVDTADDAIRLDRWHHFAMSYDGFWATFYLDGVVFSRVSLASFYNGEGDRGGVFNPFGIVIPTNGKFVMGRSPLDRDNIASAATSFQGRLSEWRFYTKPLTAGSILRRRFRRLEAAEVATMVASEGLQAYFRFNEGTGQSAPDSSGNGLHLQWNQQQVPGPQLPPQMAWLPFSEIWRGFSTDPKEVRPGVIEARERSPGRQTAALNLDADGDVVRATDAPFDVVFDGKTFTGVGALGEVETVQESGDLSPTSATLTLTGIQQANISLALSARYLDRPCRLYQVTWADDGEQLDPFLVFDGKIDELNVALGRYGTVTVTAESHLRNWRRPKHRRWNDEGQRAVWPDDNFFAFLGEMVDREVWWPVRFLDAQSGIVVVGLLSLLAAGALLMAVAG